LPFAAISTSISLAQITARIRMFARHRLASKMAAKCGHQWGFLHPPMGSTPEQWTRVVILYIDSQPARLHEDFVIVKP
jgi:hypothetical protein